MLMLLTNGMWRVVACCDAIWHSPSLGAAELQAMHLTDWLSLIHVERFAHWTVPIDVRNEYQSLMARGCTTRGITVGCQTTVCV